RGGAVRVQGQAGAGFDPADVAADRERRRDVTEVQVVVDRLVVDFTTHAGGVEQQARIGGHGEVAAAAVPVQRDGAEVVRGGEDPAAGRMPGDVDEAPAPVAHGPAGGVLHRLHRRRVVQPADQVRQRQPAHAG